VLDSGERGESHMKRKTGKFAHVEYTDGPLGDLVIIEDHLPPPDQIVLKEPNTRVTINLQASNIEYFKREAKRHHTQYQKLIRNVLALYVSNATKRQAAPKRKPKGVSV
jgi:hypothetical protein